MGMAVAGTVRVWHVDQGWGVIDSPETPGGCWAGFPAVATAGYRCLETQSIVMLDWERADQDGYGYRATRVWSAGDDPVDGGAHLSNSSGAYSSRLVIDGEEFDVSLPDESHDPGSPSV